MRLLLSIALLAAAGMFHVKGADAQESITYPW